MPASPSELHRVFDPNQFRTIRKGIIQEAKKLKESMQTPIPSDDELIDDETMEIFDLPENK